MKIEIDIPEGYEVDTENSTKECIKLKKIENKLPKTWEEFCETHPKKAGEGYIENDSDCSAINATNGFTRNPKCNRNLLPSKELAEAMLALCQLIQLRDCYNDGWKPDYQNDHVIKYCITILDGRAVKVWYTSTQKILTFKTMELRNQFLDNFRDLIEIAKPLL